jgi:hypothetical protein
MGAHWLDGPFDLSCKGSTGQHAVDDPLLSCKQQGWGCADRLWLGPRSDAELRNADCGNAAPDPAEK